MISHSSNSSGFGLSPDSPHILLLTQRAPFPPDRGDRIRSYNLLRQLSQHWNVSLACLNDERVSDAQREELERICFRVAIEENVGLGRWVRGLRSAARGRSLTEGLFQSNQLASTITNWTTETEFAAALVYCSSMMQYVELPACSELPIVADLVDVDSEKWLEHANRAKRSWKRPVYRFESKKVRLLEQEIARRAKAITLVSDDEAKLFRTEVSRTTRVLGVANGVDATSFQAVKTKQDRPVELLFVGVLDYYPNVEGISWFVQDVLPELRDNLDFRMKIVGRKPNAAVLRLANENNVEVFGDVPDVRTYLDNADIVVAPLRLARGIQNKVLEAMACALPVVLTDAAATGIDGQDGEHFLVGDSAAQFALNIQQLAGKADLREHIGKSARNLVEQEYNWSSRLQPLVELLQQITSTPQTETAVVR